MSEAMAVMRWGYQRFFLDVLSEEAPEVLESLRARILDWKLLADSAADTAKPPFDPDEIVTHAYLEWARGFGLAEDWIVDAAKRTVSFWIVFGDKLESAKTNRWQVRGGGIAYYSTAKPWSFADAGWDTVSESWSHYRERILKAVAERLDGLRDETEGQLPFGVLKRGDLDRHFRWLVQFQVKQLSYHEIARLAGVDRTTAWEAVQRTAQTIGLSLRPVERGRPRQGADAEASPDQRGTKASDGDNDGVG